LDTLLSEAATGGEAWSARYLAAQERFDALGGYEALTELQRLLDRLGVGGLDLATPLAHLSGGQKTRAGLAALLASAPDYLLLDEPTNHLDQAALDWLGEFIRGYPGAVLIVSHDRAFLDETVTTILAVDETTGAVRRYAGGYSAYREATEREREALLAAYARQQEQIARIQRDIRAVGQHALKTERATTNDYLRGRSKKVAKTAKVRERKLERLLASEERIERPDAPWELRLDLGGSRDGARDVVRVEGAMISFGGREVLRGVDLHVRVGERLVLTGPNASGKTTLLRLISGELTPDTGRVALGAGVSVGVYAQEHEVLNAERSALDHARAVAAISESDARTFLHKFAIAGDTVRRPVRALSYGERARLALALLVLRGANLLLLDEPLNHLDLASREQFEEALLHFPGTSVSVLHDRYAIERIATRVVELRDGRLVDVSYG
jgi:ATP-binding cassette subfamily F protein 3